MSGHKTMFDDDVCRQTLPVWIGLNDGVRVRFSPLNAGYQFTVNVGGKPSFGT